MAKPEQPVTKPNKTKKSIAKKRKHVPSESDDEVAPKSLIVESSPAPQTSKPKQVLEENNRKRKHENKDAINGKRMKNSNDANDVNGIEEAEKHASDDTEMREPTLEELQESEKPENAKAIVTIRQKKKQKHLKRLEAQKDQSVNKEKHRNTEYLQKWKNARTDWKFEKLRQISIQLTMFDEQKLERDVWPIALEYLCSSKGAAKATIVKLAQTAIDELDAQCENLEDEAKKKAIFDSSHYQRARQLLQNTN